MASSPLSAAEYESLETLTGTEERRRGGVLANTDLPRNKQGGLVLGCSLTAWFTGSAGGGLSGPDLAKLMSLAGKAFVIVICGD